MPWWGNKREEEVPEALRNLTPEQIVEAVQGHATLKSELEATKGQLSEFEETKRRLSELEARVPLAEPKRNEGRAAPISFLEDEDAAFNQRAAPMYGTMLAMGAAQSEMIFTNGVTDPVEKALFKKYGPELREIMKKEPPQNQASPLAWSTAFDVVKGRHMADIAKAAQDRTDFFAEASEGSEDAGPGRTAPPSDRLTDDEARLAAKYGLKPEEALASRKEMVIYHG